MKVKFALLGTDEFAARVHDELRARGLRPALWIQQAEFPPELLAQDWEVFLVASFGKIIPAEVLAQPRHGCLNIHPSLLPKYRGASPIQSALLAGERETGVTLMLMDEKVDHGPIIAQEKLVIDDRRYEELRDQLAIIGARMFADKVEDWISGKLPSREQNHQEATFTKKIKKEAGEINLNDPPEINLRKVRALNPWPSAYFFTERNGRKIRVIVREAHLKDGQFMIDRVLPEGKKEMTWEAFRHGFK